jgi:hypothetical protein
MEMKNGILRQQVANLVETPVFSVAPWRGTERCYESA